MQCEPLGMGTELGIENVSNMLHIYLLRQLNN